MSKKAIATPTRTNDILKRYGLSAKKSLGQNFIIDPNIMEKMVSIAGIDDQTNVIEVGPGIGALTEFLAQRAKRVVSLEIDQRFIELLGQEIDHDGRLTVVEGDALEIDLEALVDQYFEPGYRLVLTANLPYYITTPILMHFLEADIPLDSITVMIQKEVADRLSAQPSTKAYGSLSIAVQYYMTVELAAVVPRNVFNPAPNVDSAIIHMEKRQNKPVLVEDEAFFFKLVRQAFVQRRKTLRNNLLAGLGKEEKTKMQVDRALDQANLDDRIRGEALSIEDFGRLSNVMTGLGFTLSEFS